MQLQEISKVDYNLSEELMTCTVDRFIREMVEVTTTAMVDCYVVNENANKYILDEEKLQEGIRDVLKVGAQKFSKLFKNLKGAGDSIIQKAAADVQSRLATSGKEGVVATLSQFAKKNAKYAKPALIMAVLGASMLGMDTASANEMISGLDQMGGPELDAAMADYGLDPEIGDEAPQEDQPTKYAAGGDISPNLKTALEQKVDGIFRIGDANVEGGVRVLNSKQAIHLAQEMTGETMDSAIQKIMQQAKDPGDIVRGFKDWVGIGVKKYAMGT